MTAAQIPARIDMAAYSGDDFAMVITVTVGGLPADLTGSSALMQIKASAKATTPQLQLSSPANGITFPTASTIKVELTAAQTAALIGARWVYDLQITDSLGKVRTYLVGDFTINSDVTR